MKRTNLLDEEQQLVHDALLAIVRLANFQLQRMIEVHRAVKRRESFS